MSAITEQLVSALRAAVTALNTQPRFKVPALDSNSYSIAASADATLAEFQKQRDQPPVSAPLPEGWNIRRSEDRKEILVAGPDGGAWFPDAGPHAQRLLYGFADALLTSPALKAEQGLALRVRHTIARFEQLGFSDPDAPVDGGDCVELVGELLPLLRAALPADAARAAPGEAAERKRLSEFLVRDWESSFEQDADGAFDAVEELLRAGHAGYDVMSLEDLRRDAAEAGYGDDFDDDDGDEPEGPRP
jgi:hypothetical protein